MANSRVVTGGCLCRKIRYTINFAADHNWRSGPKDCQCTQCRKFSGSLILQFHAVSPVELTWDSESTLQIYNSSPGFNRFFCSKCGSSIAWQKEAEGGEIDICIGSIDERYLVGDKARYKEGRGNEGFGSDLVGTERAHYFCENAIQGVTDELRGTCYLRGSNDETLK